MAACVSAVHRRIGGIVGRWRWGLLLMAVVGLGSARPTPRPDEFSVIATFMIHFAQFTSWPKPEPPAEDPIVVGVVGPDPFGDTLEKVLRGEKVRGRAFEVKRIRQGEDMAGCHMIFVGDIGEAAMRETLTSLGTKAVLTMSATEGFGDAGGMVVFGVERGRVVFEINREAVARAGLAIHSRLLNLGRIRGEPGKRER